MNADLERPEEDDEPAIKWAYDDPVTGVTHYYDSPTGAAGEYRVEVKDDER